MNWIEVEAATIDAAIGKALEALKVGREEVHIEILADASRGTFGLGSRCARVRATLREAVGHVDLREEHLAKSPGFEDRVSRGTPPGRCPPDSSAVAERAREVLEVVLGYLVDSPGIEAADDAAERIRFTLTSASSGLLIGRGGRTLDALEHIVNRIVLRDDAGPVPRIELEAEGYRARRQASLEEMARRLAAKARQSGRPVALSAMSPRDRRLVHLALKDAPGVMTESEGEGDLRRVVISPRGPRQGRERARPSY